MWHSKEKRIRHTSDRDGNLICRGSGDLDCTRSMGGKSNLLRTQVCMRLDDCPTELLLMCDRGEKESRWIDLGSRSSLAIEKRRREREREEKGKSVRADTLLPRRPCQQNRSTVAATTNVRPRPGSEKRIARYRAAARSRRPKLPAVAHQV